MRRHFTTSVRSVSAEAVSKLSEVAQASSAQEVLEQIRNMISVNTHRSQVCKMVDIAVAKDPNVFSSDLSKTLSIAQAMTTSEYPLPNAEDSLGLAISHAVSKRLQSSEPLSLDDVKLFVGVSQSCRRNSIEVTELQAAALANAVLNSESNAESITDFITCYLPLVSSASVKTTFSLFAALEPQLHLLSSPSKICRLAEVASKAEIIDFAFLFELSKRAADILDKFDSNEALYLFGVFSKVELFEESFVAEMRKRLITDAPELSGHQLVLAFSHLAKFAPAMDSDMQVTAALCGAAELKVASLGESAAVNMLIGLHRRRPKPHPAITSFLAKIESFCISDWSVSGIATGISLVSKLGNFSESMVTQGLSQIQERGFDRLSATQVQQIFAILAHNKDRISTELITEASIALCTQLKSIKIAPTISPVQALTILTAMASLRLRDESVLSLIFGILTGSSRSQSEFCSMTVRKPLPRRPFKLSACMSTLTSIDSMNDMSHLCCILSCCDELEAWSDMSIHLALIIRSMLLKVGLHHLRAIQITNVLQGFRNFELIGSETEVKRIDEEVNAYFEQNPMDSFRNAIPTSNDWRKALFNSCIENLQRHEHYLEGNWPFTSRVKLQVLVNKYLQPFGRIDLDKDEFITRVMSWSSEDCTTRGEDEEEECEAVPVQVTTEVASDDKVISNACIAGFHVDVIV